MKPSPERIVEQLRATPKYGALSEGTLKRAAEYGLRREKKEKGALKAAKAKLHQAYGAYLAGGSLERAADIVRALPERVDGDLFEDACRRLLACHASSEERLPFFEELYGRIFDGFSGPLKVLDLCCGFHPFGIPWMPLAAESEYLACDTDSRMVGLLAEAFRRAPSGPRFSAESCDAADLAGPLEADLAFLLKTLPCLERQERGLGVEVLSRLRVRRAAVSFPAQSLSGREKGMRGNYDRLWSPVFRDLGFFVSKLEYPTETVYLLSSR